MKTPAISNPLDDVILETIRLEALDRLDVLDTPREDGFDGLVRLVRNIFSVPVGFVSVIDAHRQWFKSADGLELGELPRREALCDMTVRAGRPIVIADVTADAATEGRRLEIGGRPVRFYAGVPLKTRDGNCIGTIAAMDFEPRRFTDEQVDILVDLGRIAMAEFEMRHMAAVDTLTGVLTRRAFKDEGSRGLALAQRHELDIGCVVFDIDHLHVINDRYGRAAGDKVLAAVAATCRRLIRRTDHMGRLSGEQFGVILRHTDLDGSYVVAEKLRCAIESLIIDIGVATLRVSASFGVAPLDDDTDDIEELLGRAEIALHAAKAAGRNRSHGWQPDDDLATTTRRRVLKAGSLRFKGPGAIDCTVRSFGEDGAGFDLSSSADLPEDFDLVIGADHFAAPCRVVSRSERHVEVAFT